MTNQDYITCLMAFLELEEDEEFKIALTSYRYTYRFHEDILENMNPHGEWRKASIAFNDINPETILKLQWKPKAGERYYYPDFVKPDGFDQTLCVDSEVSQRIIRLGWAYRTPEKAQEKARELGWID